MFYIKLYSILSLNKNTKIFPTKITINKKVSYRLVYILKTVKKAALKLIVNVKQKVILLQNCWACLLLKPFKRVHKSS